MLNKSRAISTAELKRINDLLGDVDKAEKLLAVNRIPIYLKKALKNISFLTDSSPTKHRSTDQLTVDKPCVDFMTNLANTMAKTPASGIVIPSYNIFLT